MDNLKKFISYHPYHRKGTNASEYIVVLVRIVQNSYKVWLHKYRI
ncbi:hypothetical protein [Faecalimonas sp.]